MSENKGGAEISQPVVTMDSSNIIKVTVETLKQEEKFFKVEVGKRFKTSPDLLVLVFAGEILKDQDTSSQHRVHSGVKIHLVIRSQKSPQDGLADQERVVTMMQPPSHSNSNLLYLGSRAAPQNPHLIHVSWSELLTSSQEIVARTMEDLLSMILRPGLGVNTINNNTFLLGFVLGMTGVHLLGLDSTDTSDLESSIPEQRVPMHSLSPSVENILDNADLVRDLLMSDPQMQQLAEENPDQSTIIGQEAVTGSSKRTSRSAPFFGSCISVSPHNKSSRVLFLSSLSLLFCVLFLLSPHTLFFTFLEVIGGLVLGTWAGRSADRGWKTPLSHGRPPVLAARLCLTCSDKALLAGIDADLGRVARLVTGKR
uniref:Ubiquitin-like domain-containing protein n=1 Tax=Bubo bubo TaxID=30461 RepID=A0A8C0FBD7_BUBBB